MMELVFQVFGNVMEKLIVRISLMKQRNFALDKAATIINLNARKRDDAFLKNGFVTAIMIVAHSIHLMRMHHYAIREDVHQIIVNASQIAYFASKLSNFVMENSIVRMMNILNSVVCSTIY